MLFLINDHTLLKIHSFHPIGGGNLRDVSYKFIQFLDCNVKRYEDKIYDSDPYYCTEHYDYKDAIGLFRGKDLITPAYNFEKQFEFYGIFSFVLLLLTTEYSVHPEELRRCPAKAGRQ